MNIIAAFLDLQAMEVALRSDFPWGRVRKAGLRACSAE